jgi:LmbE family N-acetylglucosaminyl deacetylase
MKYLKMILTFLRKIYYILNKKKTKPKLNYNDFDKVLFVAHPDDEVIFFGNQLLSEKGWLVICLTNGSRKFRMLEFIKSMEYIGAKYQIWDFRDGLSVTWNEKKVSDAIKKVLAGREKWSKVVTHNSEGEYGHYQHKQLNHIITNIYKSENLYVSVSNKELIRIENELSVKEQIKKRDWIDTCYKSQVFVFESYAEYFKYEKNHSCFQINSFN